MKKFKPVSVKTIVLGRTGKSVIHTPLAVSSASSSQPNEGSSSSLPEAAFEDVTPVHDVPVFSSDDSQQSAAHRRNFNSMINWEKIREQLLITAIGEESLPEKCVCVGCKLIDAFGELKNKIDVFLLKDANRTAKVVLL